MKITDITDNPIVANIIKAANSVDFGAAYTDTHHVFNQYKDDVKKLAGLVSAQQLSMNDMATIKKNVSKEAYEVVRSAIDFRRQQLLRQHKKEKAEKEQEKFQNQLVAQYSTTDIAIGDSVVYKNKNYTVMDKFVNMADEAMLKLKGDSLGLRSVRETDVKKI